jgi:hypothetical protein
MNDEDGLQPIIESIGAIADKAEASKWDLARAIAEAYAEFQPYSRGLTSGLCLRLKRSTDSLYALRDAFELKSRLRYESEIPVSHFSTLSRLQDHFDLTDEDCVNWLDWVRETGASVREMSCEVSTAHEADQRKEWFKKVGRLVKLMTTIYQDAGALGMPEEYYKSVVDIGVAIDDWKAKIDKWMK